MKWNSGRVEALRTQQVSEFRVSISTSSLLNKRHCVHRVSVASILHSRARTNAN